MSWKVIVRTILVVVIVTILCFAINALKDLIVKSINNRNLWITDLMRVSTPEDLDYAISNNVKEFLVSGTVEATDLKSFPEFKQKFIGIRKIKYILETETKTETHWDSDGDPHTSSKVVSEWHRKNTEEVKSNKVKLLGKEIDTNKLPLRWSSISYSSLTGSGDYDYYWYESKDVRYSYEVIQPNQTITMVTNSNFDNIHNFYGDDIDNVTKPYSDTWVKVLNIILIVGLIIGGILFLVFWEGIFYSFLVE